MPRKNTRAPMRRYKKKGIRKGGNRLTTVIRGLQPFPSRYICKMKYVDALNDIGGPALSGYGNFQFLVNSGFDPNATGTGHQPYGWDTMSSLYNRYRVISCKYVVSGTVYSAGVPQDGIIGVVPANEGINSPTGGVAEFQENPRSKFIQQTAAGDLRVLKGNVYIPTLVGRTKSQYMADDRYQALTNANPQEAAVLNVFFGRQDGLAVSVNADLNVTLEFTIEFFDVKNVGRSS